MIIQSLLVVLCCFSLAASEHSEEAIENLSEQGENFSEAGENSFEVDPPKSPKRKRENKNNVVTKKLKITPLEPALFFDKFGKKVPLTRLKIIDLYLCNKESMIINLDAKDAHQQVIKASKKIRDTTSGLLKSFISDDITEGTKYVLSSSNAAQFFLGESNHFTLLFGSLSNKKLTKTQVGVLWSTTISLIKAAKEVNAEYCLLNSVEEIGFTLVPNNCDYPVLKSGNDYLHVTKVE